MNSRRISQFWIFIYLLTFSNQAFSAPSFSKSYTFSPLKMSHSDLAVIINTVRKQMEQEAKSIPNSSTKETLEITDGTTTVVLENGFSTSDLSKAPKSTYRLDYSYIVIGSPSSNSSISVSLELDDHRRRLVVQGNVPEHVEANFLLLQKTLSEFDLTFGGPLVRVYAWILGIIGFALWGMYGHRVWHLPGRWGLLHNLPSLIFGISSPLLPWDKWLSGFSLYSGDASFAARYSSEISVIGLVLGVLGVLPLLPSLLNWIRKLSAPSATAANSSESNVAKEQSQNQSSIGQSASGRKKRKR